LAHRQQSAHRRPGLRQSAASGLGNAPLVLRVATEFVYSVATCGAQPCAKVALMHIGQGPPITLPRPPFKPRAAVPPPAPATRDAFVPSAPLDAAGAAKRVDDAPPAVGAKRDFWA